MVGQRLKVCTVYRKRQKGPILGPLLMITSLKPNVPVSNLRHRVLGFFSSPPNWDPPSAGECPPSLVPGWGYKLACGRGSGGSPIRTRRQTRLYGTLGIHVLCGYIGVKKQSKEIKRKEENFCISKPGRGQIFVSYFKDWAG
jgi:hypothetical protein